MVSSQDLQERDPMLFFFKACALNVLCGYVFFEEEAFET